MGGKTSGAWPKKNKIIIMCTDVPPKKTLWSSIEKKSFAKIPRRMYLNEYIEITS